MTDSQQPENVVNNERSLNSLARTISRSQGKFSLLLARCNYPILQEQLLQQLRDKYLIEGRLLSIPTSAKTLYTAIRNEVGEDYPSVLMVLGLESVADLDDLLIATNNVRNEFQRFPFPIVLWIDDRVWQKLARLAPDFNNWCGVPINFELSIKQLVDLLKQDIDRGFSGELDRASFKPNILQQDLQEQKWSLESELNAGLDFLLGFDADRSNQLDLALRYYQQSLRYWEHSKYRQRQGTVLVQMATIYEKRAKQQKNISDWHTSKDLLQQAINLFKQSHQPDLAAQLMNQLGLTLRHLQEWDALETLANEAISLHKSYGKSAQLARDYAFLAEVALAREQWVEASHLARQAIDTIASSCHDRGIYYFLLAQAQKKLKQEDNAIANLEIAKKEATSQADPQRYIEILETLRQLYFNQGRYLDAFQLKQTRRSVQRRYRFRAFIGPSRLEDSSEGVAQEIEASGRQQDIDRLIERISQSNYNLLVIHGPSGVGKSSIISAGLIPSLNQRVIGSLEALPIHVRSYRNWVQDLGQKLIEGFTSDYQFSIESLNQQLDQNQLRNRLTILILDQFEEFFLHCTEPSQKRDFWKFLYRCLEGKEIQNVKVILSLREDYLHHLLELERFYSLELDQTLGSKAKTPSIDALKDVLRQENRYALGNFSRQDAQKIITSLTEGSQFYLEPELICKLVEDLADDFGEVRPIELQVVGSQLQTKEITTLSKYHQLVEEYHQLGISPREILVALFLGEVVKDCGQPNERVARLVLYFLTDENKIRPLKTRADLEQDLQEWIANLPENEQKNIDLDLILRIFVQSRLVDILQESPDNPHHQLVHDYLATIIRQQKNPEIDELKEKLKEAEQREKIAQITSLRLKSELLWLHHDQLEALVAISKAGELLLETTNISPYVKMGVVVQLQQIIYAIREANRLQEHDSWVNSAQFSPNGKIIASASADGKIILRNLDDGQLKTLEGHERSVKCINFSPDGKILASGSDDCNIKLWDVKNGKELLTLTGHSNSVRSISFSPNSQTIASASTDNTVRVWSLDSGGKEKILKGHKDSVRSVCFSRDGQKIASASKDRTVRVWSLDSKEPKILKGHKRGVRDVDFSPDGTTIASTGDDSTIKLWDLEHNNSRIGILKGHKGPVRCVRFSKDGKTIVSAGADGTLKTWSVERLEEIETFQSNGGLVREANFSPDDKTIVSANADGTVRLWNFERTKLKPLQGHDDLIEDISFSPDGKIIATAGKDNKIRLWLKNGDKLKSLKHGAPIRCVSFSPNNQIIVAGSDDGTVKLWNLNGCELETLLEANGQSGKCIRDVSFSPNGKVIAVASDDSTIMLWNADTKKRMQDLNGHTQPVRSVSFSPNGQLIASASRDHTVILWSAEDGSEFRQSKTLEGHGDVVRCVRFSPDGRTVASASEDGTVILWNPQDGSEPRTLKGHNDVVRDISFGFDGKVIASASDDYTVKLWSLDGEELQTLYGHDDAVRSVSFSPDGKMLASAGGETAILWNLDFDDLLQRSRDWLDNYVFVSKAEGIIN
jgi:WD40 repeat protein/DNA replication protein DnaC